MDMTMTPLIQALVKIGKQIGVKPIKTSPAVAAEAHKSERIDDKGADYYTPISEVGKFAFVDELDRLNAVTIPQLTVLLEKVSATPGEIASELGGLGLLAVPSIDELQAKLRSKSPEDYKQKLLIKNPAAKPTSEIAGLGILALPSLGHLMKRAEVSHEQALESLIRLQRLEETKPTVGQVGRYATIGAASGPAIAALKHKIEGGKILGGAGKRLRGGGAAAAAGALTSGAIPLVRSYMDRRAEIGKLKKFIQQEEA